MKKILFFLSLFLFFISSVSAYDINYNERYEYVDVELRAGEFMIKDGRFSNLSCDSHGPLEAHHVSGSCILINNGIGSMTLEGSEDYYERVLHREYDPDTGELLYERRERVHRVYMLRVTNNRPGNPGGGRISLGELALQMNQYSISGSRVFDELHDVYRTRPAFVAAVDGNSLLVVLGRETNPSVYHFSYNSNSNVLSFGYAGSTSDEDVEALSVVASNMYYFLIESQTKGDEALNILYNPDKSQYVDFDSVDDGVSHVTITDNLEPGRTEISFELLLGDDGASKVVESYELNAPRAPEEDEEDEEGPATEPTPEPEDPTEPVQPNQPIESPNTGTYLSIIGISWLLMFGMVFIYCRKTMFKKI